jgi:tRNA (Thr-GGU) A37 N-methylase
MDRPNPVGLSTVRLISRQGARLTLKGLDAIDGTPVIDVKPGYPQYDRPSEEVRVPDYIHRLAY